MRAPEHIRSVRPVGTSTARSGIRPSFSGRTQPGRRWHKGADALLGSALAGLVTFVVWGGLALAVGTRGHLAVGIAVLTGVLALVCTAVIALADALEEETEAGGDARAATGPELRHDLLVKPRRQLSSVR